MQRIHQLQPILADLSSGLLAMFGDHMIEAILFGSYARGEAEEGSDMDVLVLVDIPRETTLQYTWQLGELASELLLEHGIMVSPIVENRDYFLRTAHIFPLFRNVRDEGVRISA